MLNNLLSENKITTANCCGCILEKYFKGKSHPGLVINVGTTKIPQENTMDCETAYAYEYEPGKFFNVVARTKWK